MQKIANCLETSYAVFLNLEGLRAFALFAAFAVMPEVRLKADSTAYGVFFAEKLNEMPPEMARLVLFESSGLESVRPTPT